MVELVVGVLVRGRCRRRHRRREDRRPQARAAISAVQEADAEAITGGTGRYSGARGEARLLPSQPDKRTVVLRLLR